MGLKPGDRRSKIAERISRHGEMSVDALGEIYGVSLETIRRDLARLSEQGLIRKVHGGARPPQLHSEPSLAERMTEDVHEKEAIGSKLRDELRPGDTIFMDTGSATLMAADGLLDMNDLTIITNSVLVAQKLGDCERLSIFLLGGAFGTRNQQTLGPMVMEQMECFHADRAVLTLSGLDVRCGATSSDHQEAEIARAMIKRSENTTFLAHSSKFGRRAAFRTCSLREIDTLLTVKDPPEPLCSALREAGVQTPS